MIGCVLVPGLQPAGAGPFIDSAAINKFCLNSLRSIHLCLYNLIFLRH